MNKKIIALFMCIAVFVSMFSFSAFAADVTIETMPSNVNFYQGIDWAYSGEKIVLIKSLDLSGTELKYNSQTVKFANSTFGANMQAKSESGSWTVGENKIKIYCDSFPSTVYATAKVNFIKIKNVSLASSPVNTELVMGRDWKKGVLNDVEISTYDLTGAKLKVVYENMIEKTIKYPNSEMDWSVGDVDKVMPGKNTIYVTFCGYQCGFEVDFMTTEPQIKLGDVSRDGKINSLDALMVLEYATEITWLNNTQLKAADIDKSGTVNSTDALYILQSVVGMKKL
ncbi:MAG: dockerin type I repeat-containing protein [Ruminococcus sp.]|nr:dockerin type I repeat-containing protein [Candidatus Copronaster equi]